MDNDIFPFLIALMFIGLAIASIAWTRHRAAAILAGWATANGYQLLQSEQRYLRTGPYFWRHTRSQLVYYVTVADRQGARRSGYVRLGSWLLGLFSSQADVVWDS
jgi:hypothetical protein